MSRKFIMRSLAAAAISFATKLVVKKLQEEKNKPEQAHQDPDTSVYPSRGTIS
ncbi:MAG: hypothetical protein AAGM33_05980 [Pseudomonadota bacterium]